MRLSVILAIVGAIALGFAIGSHAMALALEKIAIGVSLAVAAQSSDTLLTQAHACDFGGNRAHPRYSRRRPPGCAFTAAFRYERGAW